MSIIDKIDAFFSQLWIATTEWCYPNGRYPDTRLWQYWACYISLNGKTMYDQWQTLFNFVSGNKLR